MLEHLALDVPFLDRFSESEGERVQPVRGGLSPALHIFFALDLDDTVGARHGLRRGEIALEDLTP